MLKRLPSFPSLNFSIRFLIGVFFASVSQETFAQIANESKESFFIGAELLYEAPQSLYNIDADSLKDLKRSKYPKPPPESIKYKITLNVFYSCESEKIEESQKVTVYETIADNRISLLELKLDSVSKKSSTTNTPCSNEQELCMKTAHYSQEIELKRLLGGYDITWAYCCFNQDIQNLENTSKQGLSLTTHIPDIIDKINSTPVFTEQLITTFCANNLTNINLSSSDLDGDSLVCKLKPIYSHRIKSKNSNNDNEFAQGDIISQNIITEKGPFEQIKYSDGFSYKKPLQNSELKLNQETGDLEITPIIDGRFLIGISIEEYRNKILINEIQRVFILNIKM